MAEYAYTKYKTRNPLTLLLIDRFYKKIRSILSGLGYRSVLDAGCGDGESLVRLSTVMPLDTIGVDIDAIQVDRAKQRLPEIDLRIEDIFRLPFNDDRFELVLALEVLEHLENPLGALRELMRVSSRYLLLSVPHEPFFRLGNLMRAKNISRLGNDPMHVQHWGPKSFTKFLSHSVDSVSLTRAFPWLIALCTKKYP